MLKRILVPLDGSRLSEKILNQVQRLLAREDAEVVLLRVVPDRLDHPAGMDAKRLRGLARENLDSVRRDLSGRGIDVRAALVSGDPAGGILSFARRYRPSLIAMTTHGRTGIRRWTRGSVAERVLRASPFPLLLWNPFRPSGVGRGGGARFRKILVPLDGSEASAGILPLVREFALLNDARVVLFHAVMLYPMGSDFGVVLPAVSPREIAQTLEPFRKRLKGIRAAVRVEIGGAAGTILDTARQEEADLIALTTHGRSGLSRWALGSVAEQVLRHCPLPLLVQRTGVPAPSRQARRTSSPLA